MATARSPRELRVRLDENVHERLERFAADTHRNLTQSVNLLLGSALAMTETQTNADSLFTDPKGATS